jgi:hypothetical protein
VIFLPLSTHGKISRSKTEKLRNTSIKHIERYQVKRLGRRIKKNARKKEQKLHIKMYT